ncbi:MAG TPA: N-glycosylase/DNA lyase [Bacteroidota bacterium]|nr:N-glycosylase/DNA lyase [Bacteroidota bacterium]
MKSPGQKITADELKTLHREKRKAIRERLAEFSSIRDDNYFYELVYCLLTPQSSAVNAAKAVGQLKEAEFFNTGIDPEPYLHQPDYYIRFHKTKAKHLRTAREQFPVIRQHCLNGSTSMELREWIAANVPGAGRKEASHFLRNIGHRNLAILDRHILKNLVRVGVIPCLPKSLTSKRYLDIERKFLKFSGKIGIPMDELDLLFWSMETGEILK